MNNTDYQNLQGISSHWLIEMLNSPAACWRKYIDPQRRPQELTDALRFGTLVHGLALTPNQLDREFIVADYERRSIAGKARYAELQAYGLPIIKPAELDKARAVVAALKANPDARQAREAEQARRDAKAQKAREAEAARLQAEREEQARKAEDIKRQQAAEAARIAAAKAELDERQRRS